MTKRLGIVDLIYQDQVWTSRDGRTERIRDMDTSHLINLEAWLLRNAPKIKESVVSQMYGFASTLGGDMAIDVMDSEISLAEGADPVHWVKGQPLYRKISKVLKKRRKLSMATNEQDLVATRCRKLATQVDELVIALRQKSAPLTSKDDALDQLRAMAPLTQALVRYQLQLMESLEIPFQTVLDSLTTHRLGWPSSATCTR